MIMQLEMEEYVPASILRHCKDLQRSIGLIVKHMQRRHERTRENRMGSPNEEHQLLFLCGEWFQGGSYSANVWLQFNYPIITQLCGH